MRLLIISNMSHYLRDGEVVGWGPTIQEIDHLATLFDRIDHVACFHQEAAPPSALPYSSGKVRLVPVLPAGGHRLKDKLQILWRFPQYARTILNELPKADVVHVRCPANICLLAIMVLALRRQPKLRWIKYAGDWQRSGNEPASYAFQRWCLRRGWGRLVVTVNGEYPCQPPHVRSFLNPCLTGTELENAVKLATRKPAMKPLRILFVGNLMPNKGVLRALEIVRMVRSAGVDALFEIVGDGPEFQALAERLNALELKDSVTTHGGLPRTALGNIYARNHILLMTSQTEGWPKVLSEAMAYGVVPIASAISCIPDYLQKFQTGRSIAWDDLPGFAQAIVGYHRDPATWETESKCAMTAAVQFSYANYLAQVRALLSFQ